MTSDNLPERPDSSIFEQIRRTNDAGNEFWSSRDLAAALAYADYRNFQDVLGRAKAACFNSGQRLEDHFGDVTEMVHIGSGAQRALNTVFLSRYACYLVIQNADPSKEIVALGQTYFAVQTRRQELSDQASEEERRLLLRDEMKLHNVKLADAAKNAGVIQPMDYAIFQNHGYMGLYGGLDQRSIHAKNGLGKSEKILDHMGSTELAANLFRATQTDEKLRREGAKGKDKANRTHREVGAKVRQTIKELGGTMPKNLPVAGSIKKLEAKRKKSLDPPTETEYVPRCLVWVGVRVYPDPGGVRCLGSRGNPVPPPCRGCVRFAGTAQKVRARRGTISMQRTLAGSGWRVWLGAVTRPTRWLTGRGCGVACQAALTNPGDTPDTGVARDSDGLLKGWAMKESLRRV